MNHLRVVSENSNPATPALANSGGGGHDGGMLEQRVANLETGVGEIRSDMKSLTKEVHEIKGRLTQMPTTFQILTWYVGIAIGLVGLTFAIAKTIH